ncbi:MAG: caspase family protein [Actinomycetota bacterium]
MNNSFPASNFYAVIVGISKYEGNTKQLVGSANDAMKLTEYLQNLGWSNDHIWMLTDSDATRSNILSALHWLESHAGAAATAVFHFSGHEMPTTIDGVRHVQMRTVQNEFISDTRFAAEMSKVHAERMWIDLALCRAQGFGAIPGVEGRNRVVTYSSPADELSYESSDLKQSLLGYFEITQALLQRKGMWSKDQQVSVENAFLYAQGRVTSYTNDKQHPQMNDQYPNHGFELAP